MPAWLLAALGVGGVGLLAWFRSWWRGRQLEKQLAKTEVRADRAELERDAAAGAAAVAEAERDVITNHVERQAVAADTAQEIRDAAQAAAVAEPADPDAPLRAVEQWVQGRHDGGSSTGARGGGTATVRPAPTPKAR